MYIQLVQVLWNFVVKISFLLKWVVFAPKATENGVRASFTTLRKERHMSKFIAAMDNSGGSAGGVLDPLRTGLDR